MPTVSVPGKLHLIGEYAVMDGHPAILASVGLRYYATAEPADRIQVCDEEGCLEWDVAEAKALLAKARRLWEEGAAKKDFSAVTALINRRNVYGLAVANALQHFNIQGGASIQMERNIPRGAGMGSSAAMALAIAGAVSLLKGPLDRERANAAAFAMEQLFHGTPSGGDNAACCYGGLIQFRKTPAGPAIEPLDIGYELEGFVAVNAGKRGKTTGQLIQSMRALDPAFVSERFRRMGDGSKAMLDALRSKDFGKVQALMSFSQRTLKELGVSTAAMDKIAAAVQAIGGAAKGCGAAAGGTMLCYHRDRAKLIEALKDIGFDPTPVTLGVPGLREEAARSED